MNQQIVSAKYIMPFPGKVLKNHYITIVDGKITGISKFRTIKTSGTQSEFISLGKSVLMPGFVNAHVHVELCSNNLTPDITGDYFDVLDKIRQQRKFNVENPFARKQNIVSAIDMLIQGGSTCVGNFTSTSETSRLILESNLSAVEYIEAQNLDESRTEDVFIKTEEIRKEINLNVLKAQEKKLNQVKFETGIAPRTLFSSNMNLLNLVLSLFARENIRFCTHIAEHADENRLFQLGDGKIYDYVMKAYNLTEYPFPPAASAVQYFSSLLEELDLSLLKLTPLLVHANFVDADDIRHISDLKASVVHCPRAYAYFGHYHNHKYPFKQLLDNAIPVALGSESTLTNSRLSMLDELRLLAKSSPELSANEILRMATISGAKALNLTDSAGILAEGRPADIIAVEIPDDAEPEHVPTEIVRGTGEIKMTMLKGEIAFQKN